MPQAGAEVLRLDRSMLKTLLLKPVQLCRKALNDGFQPLPRLALEKIM
jgi:hypothetical protein